MKRPAISILGGAAGMSIACHAVAAESVIHDDRIRDGPAYSEKTSNKGASVRKWICTAEAATGFIFEKGRWRPTKFDVDSEKWVLEKGIVLQANKNQKYYLKKHGEKLIWSPCKEGNHGWISCRKIYDFLMNTKSNRYILTYKGSYAYGRDKVGDTPFIEIGKCVSY